MNIKEHIEAGHYPTDEKGRALVPMRNGEVATICATDAPLGKYMLAGWGTGTWLTWTPCGDHRQTDESRLDLLPPPPRKVKVTCWVVPYSHGGLTSLVYQTLSDAQFQAAKMGTKPIEMHGEYEEPWA